MHGVTPLEENKSFLEKVQLGEMLCGIQPDGSGSVFSPAALAAAAAAAAPPPPPVQPPGCANVGVNFGLNGAGVHTNAVTASTEALLQALMQPPPNIWESSSDEDDDDGVAVDLLAGRLGIVGGGGGGGGGAGGLGRAGKRAGVHWQEPECDDPSVAASKNRQQQQQQQQQEQLQQLQQQLHAQLQEQSKCAPSSSGGLLKTSVISNPSSGAAGMATAATAATGGTKKKVDTMVNGNGEVSVVAEPKLAATAPEAAALSERRRRRKLPELPKDRRRKQTRRDLSVSTRDSGNE